MKKELYTMAQDTRRLPAASDGITERYFDRILVETRYLDAQTPDVSATLFGRKVSTPVTTAALSHFKGKKEDGLAEMAAGAAQAGALALVGMTTPEQYAAVAASGAAMVRIIKPYDDDREVTLRIRQAEELGAVAVGMDIDHSFGADGKPDNVMGKQMRPRTMHELEALCRSTELPFVVKGVLSAEDARKCVEAGARGIVVSHHHGIMPNAVPALMVLPEIARVVRGRAAILVDGSFENGMDVFKALAMGADAVCVGRVLMGPIQQEGAAGACRVIQEITGELTAAMARTCSPDLRSIDPSVLWIDGQRFRP